MKPSLCYTSTDDKKPHRTQAPLAKDNQEPLMPQHPKAMFRHPKTKPFTFGRNDNLRRLNTYTMFPVEALLYDAILKNPLSILDIFALYHDLIFEGHEIPPQIAVFIAENLGSIAYGNKNFGDIIPEKVLKKARKNPPSRAITDLIKYYQNSSGKKIPLVNSSDGNDALTLASEHLAGYPWGLAERDAEVYVEPFLKQEGNFSPLPENALNKRRVKQNKREDRIFKMQGLLDWFYDKKITATNIDRWNEQKEKIHNLCKT